MNRFRELFVVSVIVTAVILVIYSFGFVYFFGFYHFEHGPVSLPYLSLVIFLLPIEVLY